MDARAVALQGVGYSPLALALQGFWGVEPEFVVTGGWVTIRHLAYPAIAVECSPIGDLSGLVDVAASLGGIAVACSAQSLSVVERALGGVVAAENRSQASGAILVQWSRQAATVAPRSLGSIAVAEVQLPMSCSPVVTLETVIADPLPISTVTEPS